MTEVVKRQSITHLTRTPYHPQCNWMAENFNGLFMVTLNVTVTSINGTNIFQQPFSHTMNFYSVHLDTHLFSFLYVRDVRYTLEILRHLTKEQSIPELKAKSSSSERKQTKRPFTNGPGPSRNTSQPQVKGTGG